MTKSHSDTNLNSKKTGKKVMIIRDIQQNITDIFNIITANKDFDKIKYLFQNSEVSENEHALSARSKLHTLSEKIRKNLNDLAQTTDELYATSEQCKQFIELEKKKNPRFRTTYNRKYPELNREAS
jgi:rubrerythrin